MWEVVVPVGMPEQGFFDWVDEPGTFAPQPNSRPPL